MIGPNVVAWVEQRDLIAGFWIASTHAVGFAAVAVETGKREIRKGVRSTMRNRANVIDGEAHILPLLGSMAIFAQALGAFADTFLRFGGDFASSGHTRWAFVTTQKRDKGTSFARLCASYAVRRLCVR